MHLRTCTRQADSSLFAEPEIDGRLAPSSPVLDSGGRYAAFWLRVRSGAPVRISASSESFSPQVYVHPPHGGDALRGRTLLGTMSEDDSETATVSLHDPEGGIYCVMVTRAGRSEYGAYRIRVDGPGYHPAAEGEVIIRDAGE
jgi:hypothetical protein